ncbi:MAG: hypothetical protein CMJ18_12465 [Phycisphaeraceae bacterium]|nr:hypothetical protein [Phycisphaeraceae bacterium]
MACPAAWGADAPPVTDRQVVETIDRLKTWLYSRFDETHGHWEPRSDPNSSNFGGVTALVVTALLTAGEPPQVRPLARAIDFLSKAKLDGTYEVAVRAHVWASLPNRYRSLLERDALWLLEAHDGRGRYRYTPRPSTYDHSATQYALLGLWEASKRGIATPDPFWAQVERHFLDAQNPDGGWGYQTGSQSKASMTAAGLTVMHILLQQRHRKQTRAPEPIMAALGRGMSWLHRRFDPSRNVTADGKDAHHLFYYLYSIERVGLASGVRFLGDRDWYEVGARVIFDSAGSNGISGNVADTAFALMFLARGRVPTWATKLVSPTEPWNRRPHDVGRLTAYLSDMGETELNWQAMSADRSADQLLSAPVAIVIADRELKLTEQQERNVKGFLDRGGLLLAIPANVSTRFGRSVRELARRWYPRWPMRRLDPSHPLFHARGRVRAASRVHGVSNGARDLILLVDEDWSMSFQADPKPGARAAWALAANLYTMVSEHGHLAGRLAALPTRGRAVAARDRLTLGRAHIDPGAPNPIEPAVWSVMSHIIFNRSGIDLEVADVAVADLGDCAYPLVHLAGTEAVELDEPHLAALERYARGGGTLLVETVGGQGAFALRIEKQLRKRFESAAVILSGRSPIIRGETFEGGHDNRRVDYRWQTRTRLGVMHRHRIGAFLIETRPAILVSHEDLSLGILGVLRTDVHGYRPESARRLMTNIVLASHDATTVQATAPAE